MAASSGSLAIRALMRARDHPAVLHTSGMALEITIVDRRAVVALPPRLVVRAPSRSVRYESQLIARSGCGYKILRPKNVASADRPGDDMKKWIAAQGACAALSAFPVGNGSDAGDAVLGGLLGGVGSGLIGSGSRRPTSRATKSLVHISSGLGRKPYFDQSCGGSRRV